MEDPIIASFNFAYYLYGTVTIDNVFGMKSIESYREGGRL